MVAREFGSLKLPQALWEPSSFLNLHVPLVVEDGQQKLTVCAKYLWLAVCAVVCFLFIFMPVKKMEESLCNIRCGCMTVVNTPVGLPCAM